MIISARIINNPRIPRLCDHCGNLINGKQLRLYGAAETTDKPYVLYVHPNACNTSYSPLDNPDVKEALARSGFTYWIDKQGGSHYHKEDCLMVKEPRYHYEPITRAKARKPDEDGWGLTRIREDGRYYMPCLCLFPKRRR